MEGLLENSDPALKKEKILAIEDEKERERQIAIWSCTYGFDEYTPEFPPYPPEVLVMSRREKASLKYGEYIIEDPLFWKKPEIVEFLDKKWKINLKNKINYGQLLWIRDRLDPEKDLEYLVKVRNKIFDYQVFFKEEAKREKPFKALEVPNVQEEKKDVV